jgi:hypothetical protein
LHYAALNDTSRQIETLFLVAKSSPAEIKASSLFEKIEPDSGEPIGNVDDKYGCMG